MKSLKLVLLAGMLLLGAAAYAQSTMTDQQVLEYVKKGMEEGRDQQEMLRELTLKGVDRTQALRVRAMYNKELSENAKLVSRPGEESRSHSISDETSPASAGAQAGYEAQRDSNEVYGRGVFRNRNLNFSPSENLATPRNYRLGPGDEVIIDIFGANQSTLRSTISPEGSINVDILGPIYLNGMTIDEANTYLKRRLSAIYAGLNRSRAGTDIRLSLGQIRTIQVNILGDVENPGTYRLSALSTVFHALYLAGGPSELGTLRNIQVSRGGSIVGTVDVYDYLQNGTTASDIRLEEGDVILVPPYDVMVKLSGMVKRPMRFEMKPDESMSDLLKYAGGFSSGAYTGSISLTRQNGREYQVRTVQKPDYPVFRLVDGDEIEVGKIQGLFENRVSVTGAVYQPSTYELSSNIHTVKGLIAAAGGLLPEAFLGRAVILHENDDRTMEVQSVNLGKIMDGSSPDIELRNNDILQVVSGYDLEDQGIMSISGMVVNPGDYPFANNTTIEDLIVLAGGILNGASTARVDVNRRVKDPASTQAERNIAQMYSFPIKDGLVDDGEKSFVLEPYDEVVVHASPSYNIQKHVTVNGQVNFPGVYVMSNRDERLSDIIAKAGGVNDFAHVAGARLYRKRSESEMLRLEEEKRNLMLQGDTTSIDLLSLDDEYPVAINLADAIKNPGGKNDIVLREDDRLEIPVFNNTVRVTGAVMMPNAVAYNSMYTAKKYVRLCGGFSQKAKKSNAYIVSMNGSARPYVGNARLKPGDEIVVPQKGEKKISDIQAISSLAGAVSSVSSLLVSVALILRYTN